MSKRVQCIAARYPRGVVITGRCGKRTFQMSTVDEPTTGELREIARGASLLLNTRYDVTLEAVVAAMEAMA